MEVRKGYKQTDSGVIPDEWESVKVNSIASPIRNAIVGGPFGSDLVSNDYVADGVPVIRGQNMGTQWVKGPFVFVTKEKASALSANLARPEDLIFTQRGTMGQVCIVPKDQYEYYLISQSQMKVTLNRDIADPYFFHYLFSSSRLQDYIQQSTIQTSLPHLNLGILREIPIPKPPINEQHAIATVLSDVDSLLTALDSLIAKKRLVKQGAMQELLTGKKRLSGFNGEWEVKTLGELGECFAGGTPSTFRPDYWDGDIYWLPSGRVQNCILYSPLENETKITKRGLEESSTRLIKAQSVLVAITGATCANIACLEFSSTANQSVVAIEPFEMINYHFLYYSMLMKRNVILSLQNGSAQGGVNLKTVKSITLHYPTLPEQQAIAEILSDMDAEINALERRREKTRQLKAGMMQELLTGRIRLNHD